MHSSPVTPPPADLHHSVQAVSATQSEKKSASPQSTANTPRMVSRSSAQVTEFEVPDEDSSGEFSFDDLMMENCSDRPEKMVGWFQYLPRLSILCSGVEQENKISAVRELILSGEDIHQKDPTYGRTPLHWACIFSGVAMLELLIEHGAIDDINTNDALGMTPLACLIKKRDFPGHAAMVHCLLAAGAHLELVEDRGQSLMFKDYLTPALVAILLKRGLDINCTNGLRETPLQVAAARGNEALVEFLLMRGADVRRRCLLGCTALHDGQLRDVVAARLIRYGALVDARDHLGQTPLMLACDFNNIPLVRVLLANGASLDIKSRSGLTALDHARNLGGQVYQILLENAGQIPGTRLANS